jgi:hypothetical protein
MRSVDWPSSFNTMAGEIGERERRITDLALHDSENRTCLTAVQ